MNFGEGIAMGLAINAMHGIARVVQARHRYYLDEAFRSKAEPLLKRQDALNHSLAGALLCLANTMEDKPTITPPSCRPVLMGLEQSAYRLTIDPATNWEMAKSIHACIDLDKILMNYLDDLDSHVASLANPVWLFPPNHRDTG